MYRQFPIIALRSIKRTFTKKNVDSDQMPQNAAPDQGMQYLL